MCIERLIDEQLPPPHGNRQGLSYGQLAILLLSYIITQADHRLCAVESWVNQHHQTLELATGWQIGNKDATDDRLADLLSILGSSQHQALESIEKFLGRHLIQAYSLPTNAVRSDTTSFSVYHQLSEKESEEEKTATPLLKFGYSKDRRPDLLQYRQMLATLDPMGMPLVSATLPGNGADDPLYVPTWKRLAEIIGHTDFLFLADSKASSWSNRGQIDRDGGIYCFPVAMSGHRPKLLHDWVFHPPTPVQDIYLPTQETTEAPVGEGFEIHLGSLWLDPNNQQWHRWLERWLVIRSHALAARQIKGLEQRLQKVETALTKLASTPGQDAQTLQEKVDKLLETYRLKEYLNVTINKQICYPKVYSTLQESVFYYREQWQPERGFHLFKRGRLPALPIYFQDEDRIRGLMFLLTLALRVFSLMEYVVRRQLSEQQQSLASLYDGNPKRTTNRPTAERLLRAFCGVTLYFHRDASTEISSLNCLQQQILKLMGFGESIYALPCLVPE